MDIVRFSAPRAGRVLAALGVLTASVAAAVVPTLVSADTISTRSIELGSSTKSNPNTSYKVTFTTSASAASTGAFALDFCTTSVVNTTCTEPAGINTENVSGVGGTATPTNSNKGVKVVLTEAAEASEEVEVTLSGITNPSATGVMYARIVTYTDGDADTGEGGQYYYTSPSSVGTHLDDGSVALTITDGFSVNGSVLESLTFCVANNADTIETGCTGTLTAPDITLGAGGVLTLAPNEGSLKTQVSTNAVSGVVVSLKNSTLGGGLARPGVTSDITPLTTATTDQTFPTGTAKFGLKLGNLNGATVGSGYSATEYYLSSDVTSPYGSPVYSAAGPVSDATADLTFAATMSNTTPAGNYSAQLSLIATGTF